MVLALVAASRPVVQRTRCMRRCRTGVGERQVGLRAGQHHKGEEE
jgi:hypothetical protein